MDIDKDNLISPKSLAPLFVPMLPTINNMISYSEYYSPLLVVSTVGSLLSYNTLGLLLGSYLREQNKALS